MNHDVVLAVGVALLGVLGTAIGAVIGGVIALRVHENAEAERQRREGRAFRRELRTDVMRWIGACSEATEFRLTVDMTRNLRWQDIAGRSALHLPDGLAVIAFVLYKERELTEAAYRELATTGITGLRLAYTAQFQLRRWISMAQVFLRWMDEAPHRENLRGPLTLERETALHDEFTNESLASVADRFGYQLDADGKLLEVNYTEEALSNLHETAQRTHAAAG